MVLKVLGRSQQYFIKQSQTLGAMNGLIEEMYTGQSVVRISRAGRKINQRFDKLNDELYDANWKSQFISGIMQPMMMVIGNLGYVMVCVVGAALAMNGIIDFGVIVSFILYVRFFTNPLTQIAQGMTNLQNAAASAKRVFDLLETDEMEDESHKTARIESPKGDVEFKNVRFSYPDNPDKIIIKNFSVSVKAGQKVAIVGPTGAGKTTMVNLLMRFFEINSGSISIDGIPISDMKRENLHDLFSMVLQDTWLFEGTVRENLIYNMKDVPDDELRRVCSVCGLSHFIRTLPQGFDTVLSEKTTISAGQKQLLTIARAMLQNSPMLILDEATSSVDTRTEATIQEAMDNLTKGRTSFVIAHRLSTILDADIICVIKDGQIVEMGTDAELCALDGEYKKLRDIQFKTEGKKKSKK
jgi:ATP-binding cassette subfamily B protein